jgi:hypothetical protein
MTIETKRLQSRTSHELDVISCPCRVNRVRDRDAPFFMVQRRPSACFAIILPGHSWAGPSTREPTHHDAERYFISGMGGFISTFWGLYSRSAHFSRSFNGFVIDSVWLISLISDMRVRACDLVDQLTLLDCEPVFPTISMRSSDRSHFFFSLIKTSRTSRPCKVERIG